ncbi:MAG: membrane protein [Chitinophagaceae bacterium]
MRKIIFLGIIFITTAVKIFAADTTIIQVYFDFDKFNLSNENKTLLTNFYNEQKEAETFEIYGHTDQIGSDFYNDKLSLKRAITVQHFLINAGIDSNKIIIVEGKGKHELFTTKTNNEARSKNRRVIIYAIKTEKITPIIEEEKPKEKPVEKPENKTKNLTEKIQDTTTKVGDNLILRNINFYGGRHIFLRQSFSALQELLSAMQNIPTLVIEIHGHICCQAFDEDGLDLDTKTKDLSVRRAKAVFDFLCSNGIAPERMTYKGFARKFPLTQETNEYEKLLNRRVEIKIVSK